MKIKKVIVKNDEKINELMGACGNVNVCRDGGK